MLHMLQWLYTRMFQVFQMFHLFFRRSLQVFHLDVVSHICCKFFYPDVAYVCNGFQEFSSVLQVFQLFCMYVASVI
jgi:hypothetical protein